jgi:hypothetical protein
MDGGLNNNPAPLVVSKGEGFSGSRHAAVIEEANKGLYFQGKLCVLVNHLFVRRDTVYENHNIVMGLYRIIHRNHIETINNIPKWTKRIPKSGLLPFQKPIIHFWRLC